MKKIILSTILMLIFSGLFGQENKDGIARVMKRSGVEIYIFSEPVKKYEVVGTVSSEIAATLLNSLAGKNENCLDDIRQLIDILISNANRKQKKGKLEYDAIITEDGKVGTLIKFKE